MTVTDETTTVMLGRSDYGWGVTAALVTIDGEPFAEHRGIFYSPCGYCSPGWSGSTTHFARVMAAVGFQGTGGGGHRRYESRAKTEALVKRRKADRARRARKEEERLAAMEAERVVWAEANP